ncbi:alpha/beta fold hydrolase [Flavilitoribacter nigricans]|uniref:AB hydrolase-1 domain-containing protein n=1 Tax=Flavilitoribacter nigricans (strain ATCC 23147 / DSM 23189 / NBRC 102662 / NCIMB 1420 / SS-2) TaxID=1122177 RepID=A0A2D0NAJ6_FLAN2|nr:alpha/beta hydrolase [Flavilitoribacter nigricans]PHN05515.1 hypothetical protein CRP01_16090 [Flavilitoribacter nigricans DSM 23189 = NBRC 102662]
MKLKHLLSALLPVLCLLFSCSNARVSTSQANAEHIQKTGEIILDGYPLQYIRRGSGDPLLVVGSATYYSRAFSKKLEQEFEMIYVDSRHFVEDCPATEAYTLATFSEDVEQFRRQLGLKKISLIGHSIHAQIALDYAVRYPQHVSQLILIAGVPYLGDDLQTLKNELWEAGADDERKTRMKINSQIASTVLDTTPAPRHFAVSYHYNSPLYWADPGFDATPLLRDLKTCPAAFGQLVGALPGKQAMRDKLQEVKVPTLLVLGQLDFAIPHRAWEELITGNERIDYILMDEASHNPHTEPATAAVFDQHLMSWRVNSK